MFMTASAGITDTKAFSRSSHGRSRGGVAARLAILALLLNLLGSVLLPVSAARADMPMAGQVVCTVGGMVMLDDDGGQPIGQDPGHSSLCLFCLPLLHGGVQPPSLMVHDGPLSIGRGERMIPASYRVVRVGQFRRMAQPRAPPLAV